jgi:hypothetical protein
MGVHLSVTEAISIGLIEPEKRSKCRNIKTPVDGIIFHSEREAYRYVDLKMLQRAGIVLRFELQPEFVLLDAYRGKNGKWVLPIKYRADFRIWWQDGSVTVEDVKPDGAYRTEKYRIKKKLLLAKYPDLNFVET